MKMVVLGQIPNMNIYRSLSIYRAVRGNKKTNVPSLSVIQLLPLNAGG